MSAQTKAQAEPIIVRRPNRHHGKAHGGAWKVAYADFVTAMMALFIVLWLMNSAPKIKQSVAGYFKDPTGATKKTGAEVGGAGEALQEDTRNLADLKKAIEEMLKKMPEFRNQLGKQLELVMTGEGLRVEMLEDAQGLWFDSASAKPTESGSKLLKALAEQLGKVPNPILIEGHTDAVPFGRGNGYSNWELSADRANSARRLMETGGLRAGQVSQVRGYADGRLRKPEAPSDPANRRISVLVGFVTEGSAQPSPAPTPGYAVPASAKSGH